MTAGALAVVERLAAAAGAAGWAFVAVVMAWAAGELLGEASSW